jgi:hypothetical protein
MPTPISAEGRVNRPIFARHRKRKGGAEHRRRVLAGLDGRVVAVGRVAA